VQRFLRGDDGVVTLLEEARTALADRDCVERIQVLAALVTQFSLGTPARARARSLADEAAEVAQRLKDPLATIWALNTRWLASWAPEDLEVREQCARQMLPLAQAATGDEFPFWQLHVHDLLSTAALERGDRVEFEHHHAAGEAWFRSHAKVGNQHYGLLLDAALRALIEAKWDEAERLTQEAFRRGNRLGAIDAQPITLLIVAIMLARDQADALVAAGESAVQQYPQPGWKCALVWWYAEAGRTEAARDLLRELCADGVAAVPYDLGWLPAIACLAAAAALTGAPEVAPELYEALAPYPKRMIVVVTALLNSTSHYLGCLARLMGRLDEAAQHFEDALEVTTRLGARFWAAHTELAYADLLSERAASGDGERALDLVNRALDMARETNTPYILKRALALKLRLQGIDASEQQHSIQAVVSRVQRDRPDLRAHAAPDGTVTILFSDIEGSTEMTERLGDQQWLAVLREHNRIVREQVAAHGGFEVKAQGDGFMIAFVRRLHRQGVVNESFIR
jgi:tetratricopeptide (TPR) repeat protein